MTDEEQARIERERTDEVAALITDLMTKLNPDRVARLQLVVEFKDGFEARAAIFRESDLEAARKVHEKRPQDN